MIPVFSPFLGQTATQADRFATFRSLAARIGEVLNVATKLKPKAGRGARANSSPHTSARTESFQVHGLRSRVTEAIPYKSRTAFEPRRQENEVLAIDPCDWANGVLRMGCLRGVGRIAAVACRDNHGGRHQPCSLPRHQRDLPQVDQPRING